MNAVLILVAFVALHLYRYAEPRAIGEWWRRQREVRQATAGVRRRMRRIRRGRGY